MKSNKIVLFILFIIINNLLFGQEEKKCSGRFGIEEGVGYNTSTFIFTNLGPPNMHFDYTEYLRKFWIQPSARIYYSISLYNFADSLHEKIKMPVFIGYYTFGGAQKGNGVSTMDVPPSIVSPEKIITLFRSIEIGINPCYEKKGIQVGFLLKAQYIFSVRNKTYYDPLNNGSMVQDGVMMTERDISSDYKKIAMNTGIKLKCKIIKEMFISGEMWFGITNLYSPSSYGDEGKLKVFENNYRLLLGYEF